MTVDPAMFAWNMRNSSYRQNVYQSLQNSIAGMDWMDLLEHGTSFTAGSMFTPVLASGAASSARAIGGIGGIGQKSMQFASQFNYKSPIVFKFESGRLNSGIPVDQITLQKPVTRCKDGKLGLTEKYTRINIDKINLNKDLRIPENRARHMFRNEPGHILDTPSNRELILKIASTPQKGIDKYGTAWHSHIRSDGSQVWVQVRGNNIMNGGINNPPKNWHPGTGYSEPNKPSQTKM